MFLSLYEMMTGNLKESPFTGSIDGFVNTLIVTASCKYIDEKHRSKSASHKEQVLISTLEGEAFGHSIYFDLLRIHCFPHITIHFKVEVGLLLFV